MSECKAFVSLRSRKESVSFFSAVSTSPKLGFISIQFKLYKTFLVGPVMLFRQVLICSEETDACFKLTDTGVS